MPDSPNSGGPKSAAPDPGPGPNSANSGGPNSGALGGLYVHMLPNKVVQVSHIFGPNLRRVPS